MAEVVAAFGLVSSIITLVDFGTKVASRLSEFNSRTNEAPENLRTLAVQLPLLNVTLLRLRNQASAGFVEEDVIAALQPVVDVTAKQMVYLNGQLAKTIPSENASSLERATRALQSLVRERSIEHALDKIRDCINFLVLHQSTTGIDISANVLARLTSLLEGPSGKGEERPSGVLFQQAARQGDLPSIRVMLRLGADIDFVDPFGKTPLHTASYEGRTKVVKLLHDKVKDINAEDDQGQTPLHVAISQGHTEVARILLQNGARKDIRDDHGKTPLDYAQNDFLIRWKIQHGSDAEARDELTGNTALIQAACLGKTDAVRCLLESGASIKAANHRASTALAEACMRAHTDTIDVLLAHGADPNTTDHENWSPFTRCIWANQLPTLKQLVRSGKVDLNSTSTSKGLSAVAEAADRGNWSIVEFLLSAGANPNYIGNFTGGSRKSLLRMAGKDSRDEKVFEMLLRHGVDKDGMESDGWTPIAEAIEHKNWTLMETLLKFGARANGFHRECPYIVRLTQWNTDTKYIRMLVQKGADVDAVNPAGWSSLNEAAYNGFVDLVHELLTLGADANHRASLFRKDRNYPMLVLAMWKATRSSEIIPLLLKHGTRLEDAPPGGFTALRMAATRGHDQAACILFLRGADPYVVASDGLTPAEEGRKQGLSQFCALLDASIDI